MVLMELAVTVAVLTVKVLLEFIREQLQLLEMNAQLAAAVRVPVQETDQHEAVYRPLVPRK